MVSVGSETGPGRTARDAVAVAAVKLLIAGGFGAGKTTMVASVSEIAPLRTEELLTEFGVGIDDVTGVEQKTTTTVAMDFGRITIAQDLILYLFGTPGQDRFWFMWDELAQGAIGAILLADPRRLETSFPALDFFERRGIPFIVGVNCFDGAPLYTADEVREALDIDPKIPIMLCDVRRRESSKELLIALTEHVLALNQPAR
jgi:signal recognition particle receptor subunit beta